jgi:hypothetical protein
LIQLQVLEQILFLFPISGLFYPSSLIWNSIQSEATMEMKKKTSL